MNSIRQVIIGKTAKDAFNSAKLDSFRGFVEIQVPKRTPEKIRRTAVREIAEEYDRCITLDRSYRESKRRKWENREFPVGEICKALKGSMSSTAGMIRLSKDRFLIFGYVTD